MKQTPEPGSRILAHCGDTVDFTLYVDGARRGRVGRLQVGVAAVIEECFVQPRVGATVPHRVTRRARRLHLVDRRA